MGLNMININIPTNLDIQSISIIESKAKQLQKIIDDVALLDITDEWKSVLLQLIFMRCFTTVLSLEDIEKIVQGGEIIKPLCLHKKCGMKLLSSVAMVKSDMDRTKIVSFILQNDIKSNHKKISLMLQDANKGSMLPNLFDDEN